MNVFREVNILLIQQLESVLPLLRMQDAGNTKMEDKFKDFN
jgi:hypothetical protein